jgi:alpha-N-arabinofuranosidase
VVGLVNLDPHQAIPLAVSVSGGMPDGRAPHTAKGEILTAAALDAHNTFDNPNAVHPTPFTAATVKAGKVSLTLPAHSVVVLSLE